MRFLVSLLLSVTILTPQVAHAGPAGNALGECLRNNISERDRKDLARWVFIAMSAHPDMRGLATVSPAEKSASDKRVAVVLTRLLGERCATQTRGVIAQERQEGKFNSFKILGEFALLELMLNPEVSKAIGSYLQYVDMGKLDKVLKK